MAVGALFGAEDAATDIMLGLSRRAGDYRRRTDATVSRVIELLVNLAERGAAETELSRRTATSAADAIVRRVATSPQVNHAVDAQLDRVVRPLVATVLDDVLALLDTEPERVRSLIRDQRESITNELVDRIRSGAAAGDTAVQGTVARLLARTRRPPETQPAPHAAPTVPP
jgi:hypothetical protein